MKKLLARLFSNNTVAEDRRHTLDHIAVEKEKGKRDWRTRALKKAATKHGKPFKTAPVHLEREVMVKGEFVKVAGGATAPEPEKSIITNVRRISK